MSLEKAPFPQKKTKKRYICTLLNLRESYIYIKPIRDLTTISGFFFGHFWHFFLKLHNSFANKYFLLRPKYVGDPLRTFCLKKYLLEYVHTTGTFGGEIQIFLFENFRKFFFRKSRIMCLMCANTYFNQKWDNKTLKSSHLDIFSYAMSEFRITG